MKLIHFEELSSTQVDITVSGLSGYRHLIVYTSTRANGGAFQSNSFMSMNSLTYADRERIFGDDGTVKINALAYLVPGPDSTADTFTNDFFIIPNYSVGSKQKVFHLQNALENNGTDSGLVLATYNFATGGSNVITSIKYQSSGEQLIAGTTISVYGLPVGDDGTATIS